LRRTKLINSLKPIDRLSLKATELNDLEWHPLISIVIVADSSDDERLAAVIGSIGSQAYPYWELWVAPGARKIPDQQVWNAWTATDPRIRIEFRQVDVDNQLANELIGKVGGEYVIFLDGRGKLNEHALYWIARELVTHPGTSFIYADEDKLDNTGGRFAPHFKPDWNPDLFLTWDYVGALKVLRTYLVRELGGFRTDCSGSRGYDLALRAVERLEAGGIRHIPRVLYHEYLDAEAGDLGKTSLSRQATAACIAVRDHLARRGINATVRESDEMPGSLRVRYALPIPPPEVTLVIPTRNGLELLRRCLDSIEARTDYLCYDIIIVDNGSDDPATVNYLKFLQGKPGLQVIRDHGPFNFSRLNNLAVKHAKGTVVGLLNNDLEVINADWLIEMVSQALRPEIGVVGARLWYPDNTIQHAGVVMANGVARHIHKGLPRGENGYFGRAVMVQNFVAVTAACLVMRKKIYEEVGGLDEKFAVAFNDVDFCMRVAARGYHNLWTPYAELYHHESASRGYEDTPEKKARFMMEIEHMRKRWGNAMFDDPAYNPNLHSESKDFPLARPPRHLKRRAG
jgi:GT2 family glycosyltransferase